MRVLVVGGGAIGGFWSARLYRAGHRVLVWGRPPLVEAVRQRGGFWVGGEGPIPVPVAGSIPSEEGPFDVILFATKTFDLAAAVRAALPWVKDAALALPQNGLGIREEVASLLRSEGAKVEPSRLVRVVHSVPATLVTPGVVEPGGTGEILVTEGPGAADRVAELLAGVGAPVRRVADIARAEWSKALVNAAINPVTAEAGEPNGVLEKPPWRGRAITLLREAVLAAGLAGHRFSVRAAERSLWRVVRATAANQSSMLQDILRGRPTEIDAISGRILAVGQAHEVDLPATERALLRIRELCARRAPPLARDLPPSK